MGKLQIGILTAMLAEVNGVAKATRKLVLALAKRGHSVHVFAPRNGIAAHQDRFDLHFHKCFGIRMSPEYILPMPLYTYFRPRRFEGQLDVCHAMTPVSMSWLALNLAKFLGIPKVATHHSPLSFYSKYVPVIGGAISPFLPFYEQFIYNRFHLITTPTESKKKLCLYQGIKDPILCLTNGIEDVYFQPGEADRVVAEYHLEGKKLVLYVGRLSYEKNIEPVLRAFRRVHRAVPAAHLVLVGDGPERHALERYVRDLGVADHVTFTGFVDGSDLLGFYAAAHVSVLFSFVEAEGLVLLEAMAQGTPSIGANAMGIMDVIHHGRTGFLVNNQRELARRLVQVLQDDELRAQLGENARVLARTHSMDIVVRNWEKIYHALVDGYPMLYAKPPAEQVCHFFRQFADDTEGVYY